jgi:hypothetical protein
VEYNAHVIESILKYVAPELGWRSRGKRPSDFQVSRYTDRRSWAGGSTSLIGPACGSAGAGSWSESDEFLDEFLKPYHPTSCDLF